MSQQRIATIAMILSIAIGLLGCTPRMRVIANPGPKDQGIRYYRPKPYLKVVPAEVQVSTSANKNAIKVEPGFVSINLEYLPDFSEEYSIDVRPGLGIADVSIKLDDGWNLTEINQKLDSQTDENISAAADVIKAIGSAVPTAKGADSENDIEFKVAATDVPIGYYESVIGCGPDGRKRLYGFRYIGFLPYEMCPTTMGGGQKACCGDPMMPLFGLTFEEGRMVFKPLDSIRTESDQARNAAGNSGLEDIVTSGVHSLREPSYESEVGVPFDVQSEQGRTALAARLEVELRTALLTHFPETERVQMTWVDVAGNPRLNASIAVASVFNSEPVRAEAIKLLGDLSQGRFLYQVVLE